MKKIGSNVYSATAGEVIQITVQSVNFAINADLDPQLTPVGPVNDFSKTGKFTMGDANTTFDVLYNFPDPLPAGGKYTRTITGPGGFSDGPSDVVQIGNETTETVAYLVKFAVAAPAPAVRTAQGGGEGRP